MRKILSLVLALAFAMSQTMAQTQTFTVVNSDGVSINYGVYSSGNHTVYVDTGNYAGRIVVPDTVLFNGDTFAVTSIGTSFSGTAITYLCIPATVTSLQHLALGSCTLLDTVEFVSTTPPEVPLTQGTREYAHYVFQSSSSTVPDITIMVPCGALSNYRQSAWGIFRKLKSSCSYQITILPSDTMVTHLQSLRFDNLQSSFVRRVGTRTHTVYYGIYNNSFYETGDTAILCVQTRNTPVPFFYGWNKTTLTPNSNYYHNNGSFLALDGYVVQGTDTVIGYCQFPASATISANNISTPVSVYANMGYKDGNANYIVEDTAKTIFSSGLWIGGKTNTGNLHLSAHRYGSSGTDYLPGPLRVTDGTTSSETAMRYNKVWHISRTMIDQHIANVGSSNYNIPEDILTWPGNGDSADGYAAQLAPYYDADSNGIYNPMAGDYPIIRGDEALFTIFNDNTMPNYESKGEPMGIEIHAMFYAFNEPADTALNNTVFAHYDIYNRSDSNYINTYLGAFTDFDIGDAYNDFIGCDVHRGMYYGYNGTPTDNAFSHVPPAQSCTFLAGALLPADNSDNPAIGINDTITIGDTIGNNGINGMNFGNGIADDERLGMTNITFYTNSSFNVNGTPSRALHYYNYMKSLWGNSQHITFGGDGLLNGYSDSIPCRFMFPDNSDPWHWGTNGIVPRLNPWSELHPDTSGSTNSPSDRRGVGASGPFTFAAGTMQQLDLAYTTAYAEHVGDTTVAGSVLALGKATDNVRRQFFRDTTDSGKPFTYMPYSAPHTVGISEVKDETSEVYVYPNPTTGVITVAASNITRIEVIDAMGRVAMTQNCSANTMNISALAEGVYTLRVTTENGVSLKRVVKK